MTRKEVKNTVLGDVLPSREPFIAQSREPSHPKRRTDISVRPLESETLILDRREHFIHQLNTTASYIWDFCDGLHSIEQISAELSRTFGIDRTRAEQDVLSTVQTLRKAKLLEER